MGSSVAQLGERELGELKVAGSSPVRGNLLEKLKKL